MGKLVFVAVVALAIGTVSSCKGDKGDLGLTGSSGTDGVANINNIVFQVNSSQWKIIGYYHGTISTEQDVKYSFEKYVPQITDAIADSGFVSLYYKNGNYWQLLPIAREQTVRYDFMYKKDTLKLFLVQGISRTIDSIATFKMVYAAK